MPFREVDRDTNVNAATAADTDAVISFDNAFDPRNFNGLLVINDDVVDIDVFPNSNSTSNSRRRVFAGQTLRVDPGSPDNVVFDNVSIKNLDTLVAMTAGKVYFRISRSVMIL